MNGRSGWICWLVVCLGCICLEGASLNRAEADTKDIGVITQLSGEAWLIGKIGELIPVYVGTQIPWDAKIKCAGKLVIEFGDGSQLSLNKDTVVVFMKNGEIMVESGSAEFTTDKGQLVELKADDKVKVAMVDIAEIEDKSGAGKKELMPKKEITPEPEGEMESPEVYEPASPAL
jgi:hypothetical protein